MKRIITTGCLLLAIAAAASGQGRKTKPFVLGVTEETRSEVLSENRVLNIYLPGGYNEKDTTQYPVIYLLDGGADEDFIHIAGLVQFNTFEWIRQVPKSIVVGIANTDRKRDFTFPTAVKAEKEKYPTTGGSARFMDFIEKELQPYISAHYKAAQQKTIIGQSLGGLLAAEILFTRPYLFDSYIIISPSLWWSNGALLKKQPAAVNRKTNVYIGVGKEGLAPSEEPHVMEVDANLLAEKIQQAGNKNITVYFDYLPDEDHATIEHQAVSNAFRKLYARPKE